MLTPSYLLHAVEPAEEIAEKLHQDLVNRIVERMLLRVQRGDNYILTAADKWQIETMQEAGFLLEDIQKEVAKATGYMEEEIKQAMEDAGVRALEYDDGIYKAAGLDPVPLVQSPHMIQLMQRDFEATLGEWKNFTMTTANACQQAYIRACDNAYQLAMTGALSPSQAVKEAVAEAIEDGVYVQYPTGHRDTVETATARAVRTGISQASAHIQLARMEEMDVDLVIVSSHLGARPSHYVWQGKVYSRSGASDKYPDFVSSTGYGSVTGLCGANCRHNFSPYFEGMENPFDQYDSEENQKQYELEQRQRTLERRIRNTKRETMNWKNAADSATDPAMKAQFTAEYDRKAALLQKQNKAYNDFCESTGQKKRSERIAVAKWDRQQAAKARAVAKKYAVDHLNAVVPKEYRTRTKKGKEKITEFVPAETKTQAEAYAKQFGVEADYSNYDISVANAVNQTMQRTVDEFGPHALDALKYIGTDAKGKGRAGGFDEFSGKLSLSGVKGKDALFKMGEKTRKANERYKRMGMRYFSAEDDMSTIHHEFGHIIHISVGGSTTSTAATPLDREIIAFMRGKNTEVINQLSYYATINHNELISECVAQYMAGNPSEIALGVVDILKKYGLRK